MVNPIMKRVAENAKNKTQPGTGDGKPYRSPILSGIEHIERWLREEINASRFKLTERTIVDYSKKAARLNAARPQAGEPPDINALTNKRATFYAYRAALRYDACQRGTAALRAYNKAGKSRDEAAKKAAYRAMLEAAADLKMYSRDEHPGLPNAVHVSLGLADEKPQSLFKKDLSKAAPIRENAKLKAANAIQKIDQWREKIFMRLQAIKSPWTTFAAVAALTGARPEELAGVVIERKGKGLEFFIKGAKTSDTKGQEWRRITVFESSIEFSHLWQQAEKQVTLPNPSMKDYADAFSVALSRAGAQALPKGAPRMSAYVYRHALASDLKADGFPAEQISATLGHAVTKTATYYGRAVGGKKGVRRLTAEVPKAIKENHTAFGKEASPTTNIFTTLTLEP